MIDSIVAAKRFAELKLEYLVYILERCPENDRTSFIQDIQQLAKDYLNLVESESSKPTTVIRQGPHNLQSEKVKQVIYDAKQDTVANDNTTLDELDKKVVSMLKSNPDAYKYIEGVLRNSKGKIKVEDTPKTYTLNTIPPNIQAALNLIEILSQIPNRDWSVEEARYYHDALKVVMCYYSNIPFGVSNGPQSASATQSRA